MTPEVEVALIQCYSIPTAILKSYSYINQMATLSSNQINFRYLDRVLYEATADILMTFLAIALPP